MYNLVLILHSWLRWAVIVTGLLATASTLINRPAGAAGANDRWGLAFMATLDLQMLLGVLLYFVLSPTTAAIMNDFGAAMKDPVARFWAVEHASTMLVGVVIVHVGRVLARKAKTPESKRTRLLICYTVGLLAILAKTPWPGMTAGRPLFRL
jgi:hypothetical protein